MKHRLLIIGGLLTPNIPRSYGGATILMMNFLEYLDDQGVTYQFIQTNKYFRRSGSPGKIRNLLYLVVNLVTKIFCSDIVMCNFSDRGAVSLYPYIYLFIKLLNKKSILRKFGGTIPPQLIKSKQQNLFLKSLDGSDLLLLETHSAIKQLEALSSGSINRVEWFPNSRTITSITVSPIYNRKFVYISRICTEKGVDTLLEVARSLDNSYTIDLYGPIEEKKYRDINWSEYHVCYRGILPREEVLEVLSRYNALLLPSFRQDGEGYPGIIIEAMSIGLPCICSCVGGVPEMITDGVNGLLHAPGDKKQLKRIIEALTQDQYLNLSGKSKETFRDHYESNEINGQILSTIDCL